MNTQAQNVISRWFEGLSRTDLEGLQALFGKTCRIRNAANPLLEGPDAAELLLRDFFHRTQARHFTVIDAAEGDGQIFASWVGELTFAPGITIKDVTLTAPLTVSLRGVERFQLDAAGKIVELDITHETMSVYQAARSANQSS